jgi:hypothetical protein
VDRTVGLLQRIIGIKALLVRLPGSASIKRIGGGKVAATTVDPMDTTRPGSAELSRRVLSAARAGSVVLLHAGVPETTRTLPSIVATFKARGLDLKVLQYHMSVA